MTDGGLLAPLTQWLEQTTIALLVRESLWGFQITLTAHILGMILSAGSVIHLDLRLLGLGMRRVPTSIVYRQIMPWAFSGFVLMLVTGVMLFMAYAGAASGNAYFRTKIVLLALAGANAFVYHRSIERRIQEWDSQAQPPLAARLAGLLSLVLWAGVILAGRMTAYTLY